MIRCKNYKIGPFKSKRKVPDEKEVTMESFQLQWIFVDTNLSSHLNVILKEKIDYRENATVFANVFYDGSKLKEQQVKDYVTNQLEKIAKDGMAFPE